MLVGPTGAGKSSNIKVLMGAINSLVAKSTTEEVTKFRPIKT